MRPKFTLPLQNYPSCFAYISLQILYSLDLLTEYSKQDKKKKNKLHFTAYYSNINICGLMQATVSMKINKDIEVLMKYGKYLIILIRQHVE